MKNKVLLRTVIFYTIYFLLIAGLRYYSSQQFCTPGIDDILLLILPVFVFISLVYTGYKFFNGNPDYRYSFTIHSIVTVLLTLSIIYFEYEY